MSFVSNAVQSILGGGGGQNGSYSAGALTLQPNLVNNINQSQGNVNQVYGQEQGLAQLLQQQGLGQGPSLANAMLNQTTQANGAQAAGLLASQQGINPAMAARAASGQLMNANQQAAGQASVNRLNEQMQANQQLGQLYGQMGGQQIGLQQVQQNALTGQNTSTNQQSNINANMGMNNANNTAKGVMGLVGGIGSALNLSKGGTVPEHLRGMADHLGYGGSPTVVPGKAEVSGDSLKNDKVPAMLSPKEIVLPRSITLSDDAPEKARDFVASIKEQHSDLSGDEDDFKTALKRAAASRRK